MLQLGSAFLDLSLQAAVRLAQLLGHAVELLGERLELVAGADLDLLVELARADALRAFLQRVDRAHHVAREVQRGERRKEKTGDDQRDGAKDGGVERGVDLGHRLLDEYFPSENARRRPACGLLASW